MEETKQEYKYEQVAGTEEDSEAKYDVENGNVNIVTPTMSSSSAGSNRKFLYIAACAGQYLFS